MRRPSTPVGEPLLRARREHGVLPRRQPHPLVGRRALDLALRLTDRVDGCRRAEPWQLHCVGVHLDDARIGLQHDARRPQSIHERTELRLDQIAAGRIRSDARGLAFDFGATVLGECRQPQLLFAVGRTAVPSRHRQCSAFAFRREPLVSDAFMLRVWLAIRPAASTPHRRSPFRG
jgi:hypothetical protein